MPARPGRLVLPAPGDAAAARAELEALLAAHRWPGDIDTALIAVHEALINADRHGGGIREVRARLEHSELVVEIADAGEGYDAAPYVMHEPDLFAERGRGLWLIAQIAHSFEVHREPEGARLVLRFTAAPERAVPEPPAPRLPLPPLRALGLDLARALGAALLLVDEELVVRDVTAEFARLFNVDTGALVGRDMRGLTAELKGHFADPSAYEDLILRSYAHRDEAHQELLLMVDGRLLRRHTLPLRADGELAGQLTAYVPVLEQTDMIAAVQRSLLPRLPQWRDLQVGAVYHPAEATAFVGGDFYDFVELSQDRRCLIVGDVSGRGTGAAAASTQVRAYLRASLAATGVNSVIGDLEVALQREFSGEEFVTLGLCVQESQDVWSYTNCGHPPALLLHGEELVELSSRGTLLGLGIAQEWVREPFLLGQGDVLLLYTDGVLDAGRARDRFGSERLREALRELGHLPPQQLVEAIDARVHTFALNAVKDDHVLVAVRRTA